MNRFYLGVIACLVVALLVREGCHSLELKKVQKDVVKRDTPAKQDTSFIHDTLQMLVYVPKPYAVKSKAAPAAEVHCADLVLYRDTVTFQYGSVVLNDEVQGNRIIARQPTWNIIAPVVTKTEPAKLRNQIYFGLNAAYRLDSTAAFGPSLTLKTKRDKQYEIGAMIDSRGRLMVGAGVKFKISFRK